MKPYGDQYDIDIMGAIKAGLNEIWYANDLNNSKYFEYIIKRFSDIIKEY